MRLRIMSKTFTMRDEKGDVVMGLENVEEGNALLWRVSWARAFVTLEVGETAYGTAGKDRLFVTRMT
jgi:hypothetical protein